MEMWEYVRANAMEIFTLVTGLIYVVLEVRQKNMMWILGMATSAATVYMFFRQGLYASAALNFYYFAIAIWGLCQWRKDGLALRQKEDDGPEQKEAIHLNRLTGRTVWYSALVFTVGTFILYFVMDMFGDSMSLADASVSMLSAVATWWLGRSYLHQWLLWVAANLFTGIVCMLNGLELMSILYAVYMIVAVYGYFHWKKYGRYAE